MRISNPAQPNPWLPVTAGALYLVIIVCGVWSDGFVRSQLVIPGDPQQTADNLLSHRTLFQLSFVADSLMVLCDVALAVLMYELLRPVHQTLSALARAFRLTQAAVLGLNLLNQHLSLALLTSRGSAALDTTTRNVLALQFAEGQSYGYDLGLLFFGINCILTGYLIFKSGFMPRWLGALVAASGPVYLVGSYLRFLAPQLAEPFSIAYLLPLVAETSLCLWLLIKGRASC